MNAKGQLLTSTQEERRRPKPPTAESPLSYSERPEHALRASGSIGRVSGFGHDHPEGQHLGLMWSSTRPNTRRIVNADFQLRWGRVNSKSQISDPFGYAFWSYRGLCLPLLVLCLHSFPQGQVDAMADDKNRGYSVADIQRIVEVIGLVDTKNLPGA